MSASITTDANTSLIFLNTATTVNLGSAIQGQLITIRDSSGFASSANNIRVTTENNSNFNTGLPNISNTITLQQPFGYATVQYDSTNGWGILNTFGLEASNTTTPFQELAVNTIFFNDKTLENVQSQLNVSNQTLLLNGSQIQIENVGGIPNPLNTVTINAQQINLSNAIINPTDETQRLNVNGTVTTNFININDRTTSQPITISLQNNSLYRNTYQINPVGGYIEFSRITPSSSYSALSTYPLYVGQLPDIQTGWWSTSVIPLEQISIRGFITFPGFSLVVYNAIDYGGSIIHSNTNTGTMPLYSNIAQNLNTSYKLTAIN